MRAPNTLKTLCTIAAVSATIAASPIALAGKASVAAEGGAAIFEYEGENLRISSGDPGNYVLVRSGKLFVVSNQGGQPIVIDAGAMMKGMEGAGADIAPDTLAARVSEIEATGREETVAGLKGEVYNVTFTDENGEARVEEVVLSKEPLAKEFRDALFSMSELAEDFADEEAVAAGKDLQQRLMDMDVGVLRVGDEMTVTSISGDAVPAERFALPAPAMDMQGLGNMLKQLQDQMPKQ